MDMESQDSELVIRVRDGNLHAFAELDSMYREMAHQQAVGVVGNSFEAEDVAQEALYRFRYSTRITRWSTWEISVSSSRTNHTENKNLVDGER